MDFNNILNILKFDTANPIFFTTGFFIWFFTAFILVFSLLYKKQNARLFVIMFFSLLFYYKCGGGLVLLLVGITLFDFVIARMIAISVNPYKKVLFRISLLTNLGLLVYFKYTNFFLSIYDNFAGKGFEPLNIILPIGISFYIFQKLGYTLEVYKDNISPVKNLYEFFSFATFFPVIQAGPILRAKSFIPQLKIIPEVSNEKLAKAVFLIISGLLKKSIISDYISINFVDRVFDNPLLYSGFENLSAVFGYALQIYCDFSGYSDIAIGLALLIGLEIPPNFNLPYKSKSIKEFWQRWHISLSFWFRDYLFLPIAYSIARKLNNKKLFRIKAETWSYTTGMLVTMFLCGLWHGASWTFIVWGSMYGIGIVVERIIKSKLKFKSNIFSKSFGAVFTFLFICFAWVFFRAENFSKSFDILKQIFGAFSFEIIPQVIFGYREVFLIILVGYIIHFFPIKVSIKLKQLFVDNLLVKSPIVVKAILLVLTIWFVIQMKSTQLQPFIYFNF